MYIFMRGNICHLVKKKMTFKSYKLPNFINFTVSLCGGLTPASSWAHTELLPQLPTLPSPVGLGGEYEETKVKNLMGQDRDNLSGEGEREKKKPNKTTKKQVMQRKSLITSTWWTNAQPVSE